MDPNNQNPYAAGAPDQQAGAVPPQPAPITPAQQYGQAPPQMQQPGLQMQPPMQGGQPQAQPVQQTNPNSTQNTLQVAEIRDGIVIMSDGSFRSVLMLKSVNFDLMNPQEQEGVELSYQGFLNSLYFPIQIMVRSQKVDIRPYIEKLDKIRSEHDNMLLAMLMEDYINFMGNIAMQTNIMDKRFYIVIPFIPAGLEAQKAVEASKNFMTNLVSAFKPGEEKHVTINEADLEAAKTELKNRVQAVLSGLLQAGVQGLPLDTQELIELYYDAYNPDTATRQQLKNFGDLTAPVVTKGEGVARNPNLERELQ